MHRFPGPRLACVLLLSVLAQLVMVANPVASSTAHATIYSALPANQFEEITYDFTEADAIFAWFVSDLGGGRICVVPATQTEPSGCGTSGRVIAATIGTNYTLIDARPEPGEYRLNTADSQDTPTGLSEVYTVSICDTCSRELTDQIVVDVKAAAGEMAKSMEGIVATHARLEKYAGKAIGMRGIKQPVPPEDITVDLSPPGATIVLVPSGGFFTIIDPFTYNIDKGLDLLKFVSTGAALMYRGIENDPPDPNFDVVAVPEFPSGGTWGPAELQASIDGIGQQWAYLQAALHAIERFQGAELAGDAEAQVAQLEALDAMSTGAADAIDDTVVALRSWSDVAAADPELSLPISTAAELEELAPMYERVRTTGFAPQEVAELEAAGFTAKDISDLRTQFVYDVSLVTPGVTYPTVLDGVADDLEQQVDAFRALAHDARMVALRIGLAQTQSPVASFIATPPSGPSPLTVAFDSSASTDPQGRGLTYAWNFGDGSTGSGVRPSYRFVGAGSYTVTLTVTNSAGSSATFSSPIVVTPPVNRPPVGGDDSVVVVVGESVDIDVLSNDSDPDGDALQVVDRSSPAGGGSVDCDAGGTCTYVAPGVAGADSFTYVVSDPGGRTDTVSVSITVRAAPPPAVADLTVVTSATPNPAVTGEQLTFASTVRNVGTAVAPSVELVDVLPAGVTVVAASSVCSVAAGVVTCTIGNLNPGASANLVVIVVPTAANPALINSVSAAAATDPTPDDNAATVTVQVLPGEPAPDLVPVASFTVTSSSGTAPLAIGFDASESTDTEGPIASYAWTYGDGATGSGARTGHTYATAGRFTARLIVTDSTGQLSAATRTITVVDPPPGNRAPVGQDDSAVVVVGESVDIAVLANDSDPDGDVLEVVDWSSPTGGGSVDCDAGGTCTYVAPAVDGVASFTYVVSDPGGRTDTVSVSITVRPDPSPIAADDAVTVGVGSTLGVFVLSNDVDPEGAPLTVTSWAAPTGGGVVECSSGRWCAYTAPPQPVNDSFTYTVRDADGRTDTATVNVTVVRSIGGNTSPYQCVNYAAFESTVGLNLGAAATTVGPVLRLTPASAGQVGRAWTNGKLNVSNGFTSDFSFRFTQQGGSGAADGIAFVIQDVSGEAVGSVGGGMGYDGVARSVAIEFDTWNNGPGDNGPGDGDPDDNHIAVHTAGTGVNTPGLETRLGVTSLGSLRLADGAVHAARVTYDPAGVLRVYLDDMSNPKLVVPVDVDTVLDLDGGNAWLGFTAATGSGWEVHDLLSWQMCPEAATVDLSVAASAAPNPVVTGAPLTFANAVRNDGSAVAASVVLVDALPVGVVFASASPGCVHVDGVVTCALGDLNPGGSVTRTIVVIPVAADPALINSIAVAAATDPTPANNRASVTVEVLPLPSENRPPLAADDSATTTEDTPVTIDVLANDEDPDSDTLTVSGSGTGAEGHGSFQCDGTACLYTPTPGVFGTDTFAYTIDDGRGRTDSAIVTVVITPSNDPPTIAELDDVVLAEGQVIELTVSASDPDGDALGLQTTALPEFATFVDHSNGAATLSLAPGFSDAGSPGSITVTATDPDGSSASTTFLVTVTNVDRPPLLAVIATLTVDEGGVLSVPVSAADPDGDIVALGAIGLPSFATLIDSGGGFATLTVSPPYSAAGTYSGAVVTASSPNGASDSETITIVVRNVNRPPVATPKSVTTTQGLGVAVTLSGSDPDAEQLTFSYAQPLHGTVVGTGPTVTYTPAIGYAGADSFTYTASDGQLLSPPATVSITVQAAPAVGNQLLVSTDSARSVNVRALNGQSFSRGEPIFAFVGPTNQVGKIKRVTFWIDDPTRAGAAFSIENDPGFDLARTADNGRAYPFESNLLSIGSHTVTARVEYTSGTQSVLTASITVADTQTHQLLVSAKADRSAPVALQGARLTGNQYVFLGSKDDAIVGLRDIQFSIDGKLFRTELGVNYDLAGTASGGKAIAFNTRQLKDGTHELVATVRLAGDGVKVVYRATFVVDN